MQADKQCDTLEDSEHIFLRTNGIMEHVKTEADGFGIAWSWMKERTQNATLQVVEMAWDGRKCVALVDEDGLGKRLPFNAIATAARTNYLRNNEMESDNIPIVGEVLLLNAFSTKQYYSGQDS